MAHSPKPFFKANRNTWYAELNRVQHALGKHPEHLPPPLKKGGVWQAPSEIMSVFYKLMARDSEQAAASVREVPGQTLVLAVFDEFLDWRQKHKASLTYVWCRNRIGCQ
jgi:hypothetical protein